MESATPNGDASRLQATATEPRFDVFLSHNSAEKPAVLEIARRLTAAGLRPYLDAWHLVPGQRWQEALEDALDSSAACAVFFGPAGLGTWENEEMRAALDRRADNDDFRVIPVLLPGATLPQRGRLPRFLARHTWVDFRSGLDDEAAIARLIAGIRGTAPADDAAGATLDRDLVCPFRGLEVFDEAHAAYFFGREALTQYLVEELRHDRFVGVIGASGSGKSSVVRAGLVPRVRAGALPGSAEWPIVVLRPGARPTEALAARLAPLIGGADDRLAKRDQVQAMLRDGERGLHAFVELALAGSGVDGRVLIVVDQFEELFTLCDDDAERTAFVSALLYASAIAGGQTCVVITMRADFFGRCATIPGLAARLAERDVLVPPMEPEELRRAMLAPAELVGLQFEKGLVDTILTDLSDQPGALPLLQHTLFELFEGRRDRWLTIERYRAIGGVRGAIASRAETVYGQLTAEQQGTARRILMRLTLPGEGTEDTRRRATVAELLPAAGQAADVETVVNRLADARLLITGREDAGPESVDVAHEALIRGWPRFRSWVEQNPMGRRIQRRLADAADAWNAANADPSYLFSGARLTQLEAWATEYPDELNDRERRFLEASRSARASAQHARVVRTRRLAVALAVVALVFGALGTAAFAKWREAESAFAASQRAEALAQARWLLSEAEQTYDADPVLGTRLAVEAVALARSTGDSLGSPAAVEAILRGARVADLGRDVTEVQGSPDGASILVRREAQPPELRSVVDGGLLRTATAGDGLTFVGAGDASWALVPAADGARLLGPDGREVRLPGTSANVIEQPAGKVFALFYVSDDGAAGPAELRRMADGSLLAALGPDAESATFSSDPAGRWVVISYADGTSELRSAGDGRLVASMPGRYAVFGSDPEAAMFLSYDDADELEGTGQLEVRATADGRLVRRVPFAASFQMSDDGQWMIASDVDRVRIELSRTDGTAVTTLAPGWGRVVFGRGRSQSVLVRDVQGGAELRRLPDGGVLVSYPGGAPEVDESGEDTFTFSPDPDERYAMLRYPDHLEIHDTRTGAPILPEASSVTSTCLQLGDQPVPTRAWFSNDAEASLFAIGYGDGRVELRRTRDAAVVQVPELLADVWFPPGDRLERFLAVDNCLTVGVYDASGALVSRVELPGDHLEGPAHFFSPDGRLALLADREGEFTSPTFTILDLASGGVIARGDGAITAVSFSGDGSVALLWYGDGHAELWSLAGSARRLQEVGIGIRQESLLAQDRARAVVLEDGGHGYVLDTAWLAATADVQGPQAIDELVRLACERLLNDHPPDAATVSTYLSSGPATGCDPPSG